MSKIRIWTTLGSGLSIWKKHFQSFQISHPSPSRSPDHSIFFDHFLAAVTTTTMAWKAIVQRAENMSQPLKQLEQQGQPSGAVKERGPEE